MVEFLQMKPEIETERPTNNDVLTHAGFDRLRLLLIYILCTENLKEEDIKELEDIFTASYPDLSLNSLSYSTAKPR